MDMPVARKWMIIASLIAVIPVGFFIFFAISGGALGADVLLRIVPVIALVCLGWYRPQVAGWALIVLGIVFAGLYAATVKDLQPIPTAIVAILFCIPLILSGASFIKSHYGVLTSIS